MQNLIEAVAEHMGYSSPQDPEFIDTMRDVAKGGADAGFPGFCYYSDTSEFYSKNSYWVKQALIEQARDLGENVSDMVASFRCLRDQVSVSEIEEVLMGLGTDSSASLLVKNALAWWALEVVAYHVEPHLLF